MKADRNLEIKTMTVGRKRIRKKNLNDKETKGIDATVVKKMLPKKEVDLAVKREKRNREVDREIKSERDRNRSTKNQRNLNSPKKRLRITQKMTNKISFSLSTTTIELKRNRRQQTKTNLEYLQGGKLERVF